MIHPWVKVALAWGGLAISLLANAGSGELSLTGNLIQGGLAFGQVSPDSKVWANGHPVRVSPAGEFILGFGRDYPPQAAVTVQMKEGTVHSYTFEITGREYDTQRIDGLPNAQVNPGPQVMRRIRRESAEIAAARGLDEDRMDFKSGFMWPVKGRISGIYGSQRILNGEPRQPHYGIDIAAPVGTQVLAPASGRVTYAEDMYFSGGTLVVDHGQNLSSSFLHLHEILVEVGEYVRQGQPIALVGATGRVTGPHLDWRMNWHQQRLDPGLLMGEMSPES
ncbi:MAG: M23 family metallopeptidase [Gammaproteobacteria bacterium]|nr:M23 family metallopeptidase [Gammaproteobacteria bacterium]